MKDDRIPKMLLYGQLKEGRRDQGRPLKRFKDTLKASLKSCNVSVNSWEAAAHDRPLWRQRCRHGTKAFETNRSTAIRLRKERRKHCSSLKSFPCSICGRSCASRLGLYSHMRTHPGKWPVCLLICRVDRRFHTHTFSICCILLFYIHFHSCKAEI